MSNKKIELVKNNAKGIGLIVERDAGNPVRILTGKPKNSIQFYESLQQVCEDAILEMKSEKALKDEQ